MNQIANDEFEAFKKVHDALQPLDDEARSRVVNSVVTLLAIDAHVQSTLEVDEDIDDGAAQTSTIDAAKGSQTFASFAELHAAANPTTNGNKALVAGYWLQVCQDNDSFTSQSANKELTHLGHKIANITAALDPLRSAKPALVLQLKKSGTSRQARKTYKLSDAGVRRVQEMIGG